jgi:hypothetical protein
MAAMIVTVGAACGGGNDSSATPTGQVASVATTTPVLVTPQVQPTIPPAPSPAAIDASKIKVVNEWRVYQVPEYPDAVRGEFQKADASTIKNAGQIAYGTDADPQDVLAYYRAALKSLGWTETQATGQQIVAKNDKAGLLVSSSKNASGTAILLMLTDAL